MKRALISVYDKSNLLDFARGLVDAGFDLIASGGTARVLAAAGLPVRSVEEVTGSPEILGGRVKTLHPAIHGGILAPRTPVALAEIAQHGIQPIDLVVCNLYPFSETVSRPGVTLAEAIEQIDIGGVTLLRAAAKNHAYVTVVADPADYGTVLEELRTSGETQPSTRARLALKAFQHTAQYDAAISMYLAGQAGDGSPFPAAFHLALEKVQELRYGENPHQRGALYRLPGMNGLAGARQLHGKEMSYTNWLDVDAAWMAANTFGTPAAVIIKHTNPCGAATAATLAQAYAEALECDPVSAYGGVVGLNRPVDKATAQAIAAIFTEAIIAPGFEPDALSILQAKKNLRLFELPAWSPTMLDYRGIDGGMLIQERDLGTADPDLKVVSERAPTEAEVEAMRFAWRIVRHVKSNAIVLAQGTKLVGVGAGQMSRVDSVRLAVTEAGERAKGAVLASDAFFPFPDGVEAACEAGVTALIQPGGSIRDAEAIATANRFGAAMVFTGMRHFRH